VLQLTAGSGRPGKVCRLRCEIIFLRCESSESVIGESDVVASGAEQIERIGVSDTSARGQVVCNLLNGRRKIGVRIQISNISVGRHGCVDRS